MLSKLFNKLTLSDVNEEILDVNEEILDVNEEILDSKKEELDPKEELDKLIEQEKIRLIASRARTPSWKYLDLIEQRKQLDTSPRSVRSIQDSPTKNTHDEGSEHRRSPRSLRMGLVLAAEKERIPTVAVSPRAKKQGNGRSLAYGYSPESQDHIADNLGSCGIKIPDRDGAFSLVGRHSMSIFHGTSQLSVPVMSNSQVSSDVQDGQEDYSFSDVFGSH